MAGRLRQPLDSRWARIVPSFIAFWVTGLGMLWILVAPVLMLLSSPRGKRRLPAESKILIWLGSWLLAMIVVAVVAGDAPASRVPGAAFGALAWIAIGVLFHVLRKASPPQQFHFIRGMVFVGAAQGLLSLVAVTLHPSPLSSIRLPSAAVLGGSSGVAPWTVAQLAFKDYFGEGIVRSSGLMATSAWSAGYACLVLLLLILLRRWLLRAGMSKKAWWAATALNLCSMYFAYARMSWAILVAVLVAYALYRACSRLIVGGPGLATVLVAGGSFLALLLSPWQEFLLEQDSLRPGSSDARFMSYAEGAEAARSEGFWVLLAGSGVKPFIEELGRGAGSESTYVSLLVRGGIIALALFCAFLLVRLRRAFVSRDWVSVALVVALAIHALVEDLDVGTLTILFALIEAGRVAQVRLVRRRPAIRNYSQVAGRPVAVRLGRGLSWSHSSPCRSTGLHWRSK